VESVGTRRVRFEPPTGGRVNLPRPRLLDRLGQRFSTPVTVVAAPAGLGKTTLLAQAVEENRLTPRGADHWLTCTADDAMASSLADGLCRALGIHTVASDEPADAVDAIVEALWHRSPGQVALLLDDVHEVPPDSPGAEVLTRLVDHLSRNGHLVLSGREPLPVALSRLEVRGEVVRIGEADLRFTDQELTSFASQRHVPGTQVANSGGWPALAELAAAAMPGVETAYVWEEVLAGIGSDRRRDLALLAHIGAFDDALAAAALDHAVDLDELLAELPLVNSTAGGVRSIHALWRPFLAKVVSADEVGAAQRRAGVERARAGDVAAGLRLCSEAGAWDAVTEIFLDALGLARPPIPGDVVATWLGRLPAETRQGPLGLLLETAGSVQTDSEAAGRSLEEAAAAFRDKDDLTGELACIGQLAHIAWWWEQPERMVAIAIRILEMEAAGFEQAVPIACLARALVADLTNDSTAALAELDRIPAGSFNTTWQSLVDWVRSLSLHHLGRPAEALEAAERACENAGPLHAPVIEAARLQALWFLGLPAELLRTLPTLVDRTAAVGLRNYSALMAATSCLALAHVGRPDEAARYLERARGVVAPGEVPLIDVNLATAAAALAVARGDESAAAAELSRYLAESPLLGTGHAAAPQQRSLALWYVLVPSSRAVWDGLPLGPSFAHGRDLAAALCEVRRRGRLPAGSAPDLSAPDLVLAHLPRPWVTELALADIAEGHNTGWRLLDAVWPEAQPDVRRHADDPGSVLQRPARAALGRLPVPVAERLDLRLLGTVELRRDGVLVEAPEWRRERVRSLLAHLVLRKSASRESVAADLWPTLDVDAQSRNLRVTLTYLLRVLEPDRSERDASFFVRPHGGGLLLHPGSLFDADVWRFDDLAERAKEADHRGSPTLAVGLMQQAVELWRDDPTELANEDWARDEVEERKLQMIGLATRAAELQLARGDADGAQQMGEAALRLDPWCEPAHHVVASAHAARGDHRAAQAAVDRYRTALEDLGLKPTTIHQLVHHLTTTLDAEQISS
jgi:DNA-binding SARP family transcriptional activator